MAINYAIFDAAHDHPPRKTSDRGDLLETQVHADFRKQEFQSHSKSMPCRFVLHKNMNNHQNDHCIPL